MVTFTPGTTVPQDTPDIVVDAGLGPGNGVFRLTVVDDEDNESVPFDLTVTVAARRIPPSPPPTDVGDTGPGHRVLDPGVLDHVLDHVIDRVVIPTPAPVPGPGPVLRDPRLVIRRPGGPT